VPGLRSDLTERVRPAHAALAAAVLGVVLSVVSFFTVSAWEDRMAERSFAADAQDHIRTLQTGMDGYVDRLVSLRALFHAEDRADGVTRGEFEVFARELMQARPGLLSMSWSPRVPDAERAAHEKAARHDGISGYRISAIDANGDKTGPAPQRPDYYPVYYSTLPHSARAYGVDLQDGGVRQVPLDIAGDNDTVAATGNFRLQSGSGGSDGFYVVLPVYRRGAPHASFDDRRRNIAGFVRATFQFHLVADEVFGGIRAPVNFFLFEADASGSDTKLPVYVRHNGAMSEERVARAYVLSEPLKWVGALRVADRYWEVVAVPNGGSSLIRHDRAWIVFGAGLLMTLIATGYAWTSTRYVRMLEAAHIAVSEQAMSDSLTGLANRRCFVEKLRDAFEMTKRSGDVFAVHFLDLDGFKQVNDEHGHPCGDALLQEVATRLLARVRSTDLVARFGGDEFAVLQTRVASPSAAGALAEKLVEGLAAPYTIDGTELNVTASIGIAFYTPSVEGPTSIMMQADLALYSAKAAGRNRVRIHGRDYDPAPPRANGAPASTAA
jgi:diguanylate cyclase (GGDEF)-like protein